MSKDFQTYVQHKGIHHELTAPYNPEQNSDIECDNQTVVEYARNMLHHRSLPLELCGEAINTTIYILNRVSSRTLHGATPYTKWYDKPPDVSYFREFGFLNKSLNKSIRSWTVRLGNVSLWHTAPLLRLIVYRV